MYTVYKLNWVYRPTVYIVYNVRIVYIVQYIDVQCIQCIDSIQCNWCRLANVICLHLKLFMQ